MHQVAQALHDGVREDEELTRDLALRPTATSVVEETESGNDTAPDPFDVDAFARLVSTEVAAPSEAPEVLNRTTAIDRRPAPAPAPVATTRTTRITGTRRRGRNARRT